MSLSAAVIRELVRAGLEGEALIAAAERIEDADGTDLPARTARQERNRRYYENRKASEKRLKASYSDVSDAPDPALDKKGVPPNPLTEKTQPTPSPPIVPPAPKSAREELAVVLDAERAAAVIEHRQRLRKPLTAYAAKRLALKFAQAPDANAAADAMVENGWQGFEPSWLADRIRPSTGPPGNERSGPLGTLLREIAQRQNHEPDFDIELAPLQH